MSAEEDIGRKKEEVYTLEEVARHKKAKDCWVVFQGEVFNITSWLPDHPGGSLVLKDHAGTDITAVFNGNKKHRKAFQVIKGYRIGVLEGYEAPAAKAPARENSSSICAIL